jgi:hypothetical protein
MDHKISSLEQARTWTMVPHPTEKNVVGCKWVFRLERKVDGSIVTIETMSPRPRATIGCKSMPLR